MDSKVVPPARNAFSGCSAVRAMPARNGETSSCVILKESPALIKFHGSSFVQPVPHALVFVQHGALRVVLKIAPRLRIVFRLEILERDFEIARTPFEAAVVRPVN